MKELRVKYFAAIREAVGQGSETLRTEAATAGALRDELIARGEPYAGALARGKSVRIAVDQVMCDEATVLPQTGEVAFFPPVTGG